MSLKPTTPGSQSTPLSGIDEISLPVNAVLIFSHPAVKRNGRVSPLYIYSGATAIQWAYTLNTKTTPTVGGEVVQILSSSAGPINIQGQTAGLSTTKGRKLDDDRVGGWVDQGQRKAYGPNHELKAIVEWFRDYMEVAGSNTRGNVRRDERAIDFKYPERNWHFKIQVTNLSGFRYDSTVISPIWSITAEIVTDNALDYFQGATMSSFTDNLISNVAVLGKVGLSAFGNSGTETSNAAFGNTGDFGSSDPFLNPELSTNLTSARQFGDNFQRLVAAWSSGDTNFVQGAFGALADNQGNPKNVDQVYQSIFGSNFISGQTSGTGTSGSGQQVVGSDPGTTSSNNSLTSAGIAGQINQAFLAVGIPGYLGVAVALQESSLNPDRTQQDCNEKACGIGLFQVSGDGSGADNQEAVLQAGIHRVYNSTSGNITPYYSIGQQIQAAAGWFTAAAKDIGFDPMSATPDQLALLAYTAQRPHDQSAYEAAILGKLSQAKELIGSAAVQAAASGFVSYDQGDPRWASHPIYSGGDTIGGAGCGPTSAAMVIATLTGKAVTPIQTGDYMTQNNGFAAGKGASTAGLEAVCQSYGLNVQTLSSWDQVSQILQQGGLVISGGHGDPSGSPPYVSAGHVVVFRSIASNGNIIVGNPAGNFPNPSGGFPPPIAGMQYMIGVTK